MEETKLTRFTDDEKLQLWHGKVRKWKLRTEAKFQRLNVF